MIPLWSQTRNPLSYKLFLYSWVRCCSNFKSNISELQCMRLYMKRVHQDEIYLKTSPPEDGSNVELHVWCLDISELFFLLLKNGNSLNSIVRCQKLVARGFVIKTLLNEKNKPWITQAPAFRRFYDCTILLLCIMCIAIITAEATRPRLKEKSRYVH